MRIEPLILDVKGGTFHMVGHPDVLGNGTTLLLPNLSVCTSNWLNVGVLTHI